MRYLHTIHKCLISICLDRLIAFGLLNIFTILQINILTATTILVPQDINSIQQAIIIAKACDTIKVAPGFYFENLIIDKSDLVLIGPNGLATPNSLQDDAVIDGGQKGITVNISADRVTLEGFTIRNGKGNSTQKRGANIICTGDNVIIIHNLISNGATVFQGEAGAFEGYGGGIYLECNNTKVIDNHIVENLAWGYGGGIDCRSSSNILIINNFISGNQADWAGGISLIGGENIWIFNNVIEGNFADTRDGGGLLLAGNLINVAVVNNTMVRNRAVDWGAGGGLYINPGPDAAVLISNNIFSENSNPRRDNLDTAIAGGLYCNDNPQTLRISNNCFFDNEGGDYAGCDASSNAIFVNPQFVSNNNFGLRLSSPCIDAGIQDSPEFPPFDKDNKQRIWDGNNDQISLVDIGALEFNAPDYDFPVIINQPQDLAVFLGEPAQFLITLNSSETLNYYWKKDGVIIPNSNTNTLIIPSVTDGDFGTYQCVIESEFGARFTSDIANLMLQLGPSYYHAFENFDDDADRLRSQISVFNGGNRGIIGNTQQIQLDYDLEGTISGRGRALEILYDDLDEFTSVAFSFHRLWYGRSTSFNLKDLFPDFEHSAFKDRQVDSIAFSYYLDADQPLSFKLEMEDIKELKSEFCITLNNSQQWERISVAIDDFTGEFDPTIAKFLGMVFAKTSCEDQESNENKNGRLLIDDIYLVENNYEKPTFDNQEDLLDYINAVNFRHFWMEVDQESKFALDRNIWSDLISIDAIGFQLSSYVIAAQRGWISKEKVEQRVQHILDYLLNVCQHAETEEQAKADSVKYATVKGNWAHFLDHKTLGRKNTLTEYSLFSNALLLSGVISAGQYFTGNESIVSMADQLYEMTDWNFLYRPEDGLMNYHWTPESGFSEYFTDWFSEELDLVFLLGISAPLEAHRLPQNPYCSPGYKRPICPDQGGFVYSAPGSNFTYYFLQMYAKFDESSQRYQNSVRALQQDVDLSRELYKKLGYDPRIFGTTACEGPDSAGFILQGLLDTSFISNYHAYGYDCRFDDVNPQNGTVAVYGTAAPILFTSKASIDALSYYYYELDELFETSYGYSFFSPIFAFPDAFHLNPAASNDPLVNSQQYNGPWISAPRFGIDVGPMMMNIDSYLTEKIGYYSGPSIRELFSNHPTIRENLSTFATIPSNDTIKVEIVSAQNSICSDETLEIDLVIDDTVQIEKYEWFVSGAVQEEESAVFAFQASESGAYEIQCLLSFSNSCGDFQDVLSDVLTVTVKPLPESIDFTIKSQILNTLELAVDATDTTNQYSWNFDDGQTATGSSVTHTYAEAGTYDLCLQTENECGTSATTCQTITILDNKVEICLDSLTGIANTNLLLPIIWKSSATQLATFQGSFEIADPSVATIPSVLPGLITPLFSPENQSFTFFDENGEGVAVQTNDTLFFLSVTLVGDPGSFTQIQLVNEPVALEAAGIIDGQSTVLQIEACSGWINISPEAKIFGKIYFWQNQSGVALSEVSLESKLSGIESIQQLTTGEDGLFSFTVPAGSQLRLWTEKDINLLNGLSTFPLFLLQQHILGKNPPEIYAPYQIIAGDANCDNQLTTLDLLMLQRLIIGMDTDLQTCPSWVFVPETHSFLGLNDDQVFPFPQQWAIPAINKDTLVNFIAVKIGGLSQVDPSKSLDVDEDLGLLLELQQHSATAGEKVQIKLKSKIAATLAAFQFSLDFDDHLLDYLDVSNPPKSDFTNIQLYAPRKRPGLLNASWYRNFQENTLTEPEEVILELSFLAKGDIPDLANLFQLDQKKIIAEVHTMDYEVGTISLHSKEKITNRVVLYQVYPNPSQTFCNIPFLLDRDQRAKIVIRDMHGRMLQVIDQVFTKGPNSIEILVADWPSGSYSYSLHTASFTETKLMQVVHH